MDVQLQELIETIKTEGIQTADQEAKAILDAAKKEAEEIKTRARKEADVVIAKANDDAARAQASAEAAMRQASRDVVLSLRTKLEAIFTGLIKAGTAEALKGDALKECVVSVLKNWKGGTDQLDVVLNPKDLDQVESQLKAELAKELKEGLTIKAFHDMEAGFRISEKDGSAFFDFSDEELSQILSRYLNPRLAAVLAE